MSFMVDLWRGQVSLAKAGGLFGLLGMVVLVAPLLYLQSVKSPLLASPLVAGFSLFLLFYACFIAIAIWRSASNHTGARAWSYVAKGSILFIAAQVAIGLA